MCAVRLEAAEELDEPCLCPPLRSLAWCCPVSFLPSLNPFPPFCPNLLNQPHQAPPYQKPAAEQPKWRVNTKPGASGAAALQGFADDAYAECFPSMADYGVVDDDDDDPKKAKAAAAAAAAAGGEGGAAAAGGAGGKGKRGGAAGGAELDPEKKLHHKLSREVQQMQGIFKDKGWGNDAAFKKEDKLDSVAATPARKRLRI